MERIDKILAHEGYGSRKDIKKLLRSCDVLLNGKKITDPGTLINQETDSITIDGEAVDLHQNLYIMMNKIMHTISSSKDGEHQTVFDLLEDNFRTPYLQDKLHLIGRLDMDTEGLLLFTTDGTLTHRLISPKSHVSKTYLCVLEKAEGDEHKKQIEKQFMDGIHIAAEDNEPETDCQPGAVVTWPSLEEIKEYIQYSSMNQKDNFTYPELTSDTKLDIINLTFGELENRVALLTIYEGKYHQVKRMFAAVDNKITFLKRVSVGQLKLPATMEPADYTLLSLEEVSKLN